MPEDSDKDQIEQRLGAERIGRALARELPRFAPDLEITGIRALGFRLSPGKECTGGFALDLRRTSTGETLGQNVLVHLTDVAPCKSPGEAAIAAYADLDQPIPAPEIRLPELSAVLHPAALDPRLPELASALGPNTIKPILKDISGARGASLRGVRARVISHTPGARATIRYQATIAAHGTQPEPMVVIGKLNAHQRLALVAAEATALWRMTSRQFLQARPLGVVEPLNHSLQSMLAGARLNSAVEDPNFPHYLRRIADALAAIHATDLPLERVRKPVREVRSVESRLRILRTVSKDPDRINLHAQRLADAIHSQCLPSCPVHADFHHANILVVDGEPAVIDFDEMAYGDPRVDVARFPISLSVPSLNLYRDLRLAEIGRTHFVHRYLDRSGQSEGSLRLFEAAAYLATAATAWRLNRPGWEAQMNGFIERSEAALSAATNGPTHRPKTSLVPTLTLDARRRWVSDPDHIKLLFKPAIFRLHRVDLGEATLSKEAQQGKTLRLRWSLRAEGPEGRWRGTAVGVCRAGLQGSRIARAVEILRPICEEAADAFRIPEILVGRGRSGLLAWEFCQSDPIDLGTGAMDHATALGRALSHLNGLRAQAEGLRFPFENKDGREAAVPTIRSPKLEHFGAVSGRLILLRPERLCLGNPGATVKSLVADIQAAADQETARRFEMAYLCAARRPPTDPGVPGTHEEVAGP